MKPYMVLVINKVCHAFFTTNKYRLMKCSSQLLGHNYKSIFNQRFCKDIKETDESVKQTAKYVTLDPPLCQEHSQ